MIGDQCPMFFDDGQNPYKEEEERIITFFRGSNAPSITGKKYNLIIWTFVVMTVFNFIIIDG